MWSRSVGSIAADTSTVFGASGMVSRTTRTVGAGAGCPSAATLAATTHTPTAHIRTPRE